MERGAQPPELTLPERYRLRRHLATGGMASVWCADDLVLGRKVAIKVLSDRFAHDEVAVRRFKREARAAARVSAHPHVVTIYDVGELEPDERGAAGRAFIVMEHLAGGTVADAIRVGAVRHREALRWLREAASALDHAHGRGIVHRDVKPANCLLDRSRVLHVADFGIARMSSEDTLTGDELFGTAAYLSPEQALGREATGASDRYALAVVAFELLAGERPFAAEHFAAQARLHIEAPCPRISERNRTLPAALDEVIARGLAKQPDERFETARALTDAIDTALSGGVPATARLAAPQVGASLPAATTRRSRSAFVPVPATARAATLRRARAARPPARSRLRPRLGGPAFALTALLAAVVGIGWLTLGDLGGQGRADHAAGARGALRAAHRGSASTAAAAAKATLREATRQPAPTTSSSSTATPPPFTAAQLESIGHSEMLDGDYATAITTLRRVLALADRPSLTYTWGLYDLGRSLLLAGDAADAVTVLEQRLQIPNQTPIVLATLNQALIADGRPPIDTNPSGHIPPGQAKKDGSGWGSGGGSGSGGAAEHANLVD